MTKLSHNMRQALIDLENPHCTASVYWSKGTMRALCSRGLVCKRDNGVTWSWEVRPEGKALLQASGTSGSAAYDDLQAENAALRERVEALEKMADWLASEHIKLVEVMYPHDKGRYTPEDMIEAAREAIS